MKRVVLRDAIKIHYSTVFWDNLACFKISLEMFMTSNFTNFTGDSLINQSLLQNLLEKSNIHQERMLSKYLNFLINADPNPSNKTSSCVSFLTKDKAILSIVVSLFIIAVAFFIVARLVFWHYAYSVTESLQLFFSFFHFFPYEWIYFKLDSKLASN